MADDAAEPLSIVLPVYNEAAILETNVAALVGYLVAGGGVDRFEIILACNGCGDGSDVIGDRLAQRYPGHVRCLHLATRGLGLAIRAGIDAAAYDRVMFYAVDLPFGLSVVSRSVAAMQGHPRRIVIGSKGHPESAVERSAIRLIYSWLISVLNNLLFHLHVNDTQGSQVFPKEILRRYGLEMDSAGPFFQAQIVIYGKLMGCDVVEIPVSLKDRDERSTRFKLIADGAHYIIAMVREKRKLASKRAQVADR